MKRILLELTDELLAAIDAARGDAPRNPWLEAQLRRIAPIRAAAKELGLTLPDRPMEGRGQARAKKQEADHAT